MALNLPNIQNPFSKYSNPSNTVATQTNSTFANTTPDGTSKVPTSAPVFTATPTPLKPTVDTSPVAYNAVTTQQPTPSPVVTTNDNTQLGNVATATLTQTPPVSQRETQLSKLLESYDKLGTMGQVQSDLEQQQQLVAKEQELNKISAEAATVERNYELQERELMKNATGLGGGALTQSINEVRRNRNQELADFAIRKATAQGDVDLANRIVERKLKAEFEPVKNQIESIKTFLSVYGNDLTDSEKLILESQLKTQENTYKTGVENGLLSQQAQNYQKMLTEGTITIDKVPEKLLGYINTQGFVAPEQKASIEKSMDLANKTNQLLKDLSQGGSFAIGAGIQKPLGAIGAFFGGGTYEERKTQIANIKALLTLENTKYLKGAMSDKDIALLQEASSNLNPNMPEETFKRNLKDLSDKITTALITSKAVPMDTKEQLLTTKIIRDNPKATPEQVAEMVDQMLPQSFSQAGNATASNIANAIKTVESGGNYNAKGASGEIGAYQFMGSTWKQWAKEFLGDANAQPTPQNQDAVAQAKIESLLQQGKTPEEIALIWNAGTAVRRSGVNKYGVKYDSGAYADKVIKQLMS